jgi:hypothetical protein
MLNSTAKNLLVCIAFLFYLNGCSEVGSVSDDGGSSFIGGNNTGIIKEGVSVIKGRVIDVGDEWLYRKGTSAPPSDWISVGFDDSNWLAGNTGIGYGDDDDSTILSDMQGNYATVYTRKVINYDGSLNVTSLALEIDYDDGFVAYINGQEVARANMPVGQPSFDTLASGSRESGTAVLFNLDGFISLIGTGDNVLAIEIHNASLTSSDLSFLPRLLVNMEELPPPTGSLSANPTSVVMDGSTTLNWNSTNATGCTASGDWSGSLPSSGSQTITSLTSNSNFNLSCTGAGGTVNESVNVTVALSSNGTALLSWAPPTENTDDSPLTDLAGYKIRYGTSPGNYSNTEIINNPGLTSFLIENLASADWYFVMTAFNDSGIESGYSTEVSKTIN